MAIARIAVRTHSRSRGHSVAAAWAYRSGQCFVCSRTGEEHDYRPRWRRRADEVQRRVIWPNTFKSAPAVAQDEQALIDAIEHAERRWDATILRDIQLALADELPIEDLPELVEEMAQELADEYHTIAMYAIHPPEPRGDRRNVHAHILLATRMLDPKGDGFAGKLRILDRRSTGPKEIVKLRNTWCAKTNERLERAGSEARIYPGRRLDAPPMPTIPRRYIARAHKRAARRERLEARREGRKADPIRKRVAELATLAKPANRAMGEIAKHVAAGYDVPENERVYETTARTRFERTEEYKQARRDAAHYASLPVVREELAAANAELDSLERRIEALRAVRETDFARAEPVTPVVVAPLRAPPVPEEDGREREPVFTAQDAPAPALSERAPRAEPIVPVATAPVMALPVSEDDTWDRESVVLSRRAIALDAAGEPAEPEPVARLVAAPIVAPAPLEDAELHHDPDLWERVKHEVRVGEFRDQVAQEFALVYSDAEYCEAAVEEAMRHHIGEAPGPLPCLTEIPRDAEANSLWGPAWRMALDLYEWPNPKDDRERIEQHIERVCARARTDDAWRDRVVRTLAGLVGLMYYIERGEARNAAREPSERDAREVARNRMTEQFAKGGIEAWCEQTVARAAGLEVDWRFGDLTRSRASGLIAEDRLRGALYPFVRAARTLNRDFPQRADERENALTVSEWHGRLGRLVSDLRGEVRQPEQRGALIDAVVEMMLPDVRLEQMRGGSARAAGEQAPPTIAERDQALRTITRARARTAGLDGELEVAPGRASAARTPADDTREVGPQAPPEPQTANIELEHPDRVRLRRELDERLEDMLRDVCLFGPGDPETIVWLAPDGVPKSGETAHALDAELARRFRPALERIRAHKGTEGGYEHTMHELERCREHVSDATNRRRIVDDLVAAAGAHYEAEWLPPLESEDRRGAREREELRAALETQILAGAEAAGEAQILSHAGIRVESPLRHVAALGKYLDDGGFVAGIVVGRPERAPVQNAVKRWREHCATHRGEVASMLLEAMWPDHWERYRRYRRRTEVERVPTREERDQAILDATESPAPTPPRSTPSRNQGRGPGC